MRPHFFHFTTKGLFLRQVEDGKYVVQDVFGTCSLPFEASDRDEIENHLLSDFGLRLLIDVQNTSKFPHYGEFNWKEIEYYFTAHLGYGLHWYLMNEVQSEEYNAEIYMLPLAYLEFGYGDGSRLALEYVDKQVRAWIADKAAPYSLKTLDTWLVISQFQRIRAEIASLLERAIRGFLDLLRAQRACIVEATPSIAQLGGNEVIHHGTDSYAASTAASMSAISMCTSLDLLSKLIHYLDQIDPNAVRFKPAGGNHFADLLKLKTKRLPAEIGKELMDARGQDADIAELIQFRHDVVHSTSALELEKVYVGIGTPEIKEMPLHYSYQGWRDCLPNGQPQRYLGRDYFVESHTDIEQRIFTWLKKVIALQLESAHRIHGFLQSQKAK